MDMRTPRAILHGRMFNGYERTYYEPPEGEFIVKHDPSGAYRPGARFSRSDIRAALLSCREAFEGVTFVFYGREWTFGEVLPRRPRRVYKK